MPGLDQTGPLGKGRKTGWGLGKCSEESTFSKENSAFPDFPNRAYTKRKRMGIRKAKGFRNRGV